MKAAGASRGLNRYLLTFGAPAGGWILTVGATGVVAIAYCLAARLGLALTTPPTNLAVFWPASGIATGIAMICDRRGRAALVCGVIVGTVAAERGLLTPLLNGFCNAGEPLLATWLLERWFGRPFAFANLRRVGGFLAASCFATATSAIGGAAIMTLLHAGTTAPYWEVWRAWFLSGWVGLVVVAPLVIGLAGLWRKPLSREEWIEGLGVLGLTAVACSYTMIQKSESWLAFSPGALVLPLLLWLTARCQPSFGIAGAFVVSTGITFATTFGIGRFGDVVAPIEHRVAGAQLAMMTITLFTLVLAVLFDQRKKAEAGLRESKEQLAKERTMLARLHEVGSRLWRTRDLHQALDEILVGAIELLGADTGVIRLLDTTRELLKVEAHRGLSQEFLDSFGELPAGANSACGRALRSGERSVIDDVEADTLNTPLRSFARTAGYRAAQATPIMSHQGIPLGLLSTHYRTGHRHTAGDLLLLDLYVRQAADIIERHKGEDALRESEERLRLAQLKTGISVWDRNLRTGKITLTPELEALWGLKPGTMKCYSDFRAQVHPDDIAAYEAARDAAVRRQATFEVEYRIIRRDGQVRWMITRGGAFYDEVTGEPIRLVGNDADITERKKAELALAERNTQLELASKTARVGTFVMEFHAGLIKLSPGCASIFGLPESTTEISREDGLKLVHPEDLPRLELRRDQAFLKQQREFVAQYRIRRVNDGKVRWMEVRGLIFYCPDTQPSRAIAVIIDFTDRKLAEETLAERNLQLEAAGRVGLVGSYAYDAQTERLQISSGYAAIYGLSSETTEVTYREWLAYVHPEDIEGLQAHRTETFKERQADYKIDFRIVRQDGETRWIESRGFISYYGDARPQRVIGVNIDVTERKRAGLALAEREAQLALAAKAARVGCYANNLQTGVIAVSDGYVAIHELPEGTAHTTFSEWRPRVHPDDLAPFDELLGRIFGSRQRDYTFDYRIIRAGGSVRWIESRGSVSYDEHGQPQHCIGINIDVTDRKISEFALAERNAQLTLAGNVAGVGYFAYDVATRHLVAISHGYAAIYGWPEGTTQMTVDYWRTRVHPDDLAQFDHVRRRVFASRSHDHSCDFRIFRADGQIRWIDSRRFISYDGEGNPLRIIGVNIDVTERKQTEALLKESTARLSDALAAGQVVAFEWDAATGRSQRSDNAERILGFVQGGGFLRQVHPADRRNFNALIRNLSPGNASYTLTFRFARADGRDVWLEEEAKGEFDTSGKLLRIKGLTRDITERKVLEEHKNTLISELDHRVKNVLALVSSVAARTQETSGSMMEFVAALDGRIKSMAITHELLSSRHWQGIPLAELVRRELTPYATANNTRIVGPDVVLSAEAGQILAMVFHEFATNAAKFGAISVKTGRVSVRWSIKLNKRAKSWLRIQWQERGGPQVSPPTRSGFGTSVVRELVPYELGGSVEPEYRSDGFRCRLNIPAHWLAGM